MILLRPWLQPSLSAIDREVDAIGRHLWKWRLDRLRAHRRGLELRRTQRGFIIDPFRFGGASDPDFASVSLLLPLTGTNGGTSFPDVSSFSSNHTITRAFSNTDTTTSTAQSQWAGSSMLINSTGGGLNVATIDGNINELHYQANTDFSIEMWVRWTNSGSQYLCDHGTNASALIIVPSSGNVQWYATSHYINAGSTAFSTATWYFLQLVRSGTGSNNIIFARNGVSYETGTGNPAFGFGLNSGGNLKVGNYGGDGIATVGHMQDVRITNGVARSIAVPTEAFPTS